MVNARDHDIIQELAELHERLWMLMHGMHLPTSTREYWLIHAACSDLNEAASCLRKREDSYE